ncbi:MAG TPA: SDR family oxidoreductase, partial [Acidimicrobiia bacterium]|nr:SDR family oxidoreductase [Acidimicrobiia bacterium]
MGRLEDRVAVITGSGQGIGLAYAERFLQEGAKVVVAEINEDRARSAMKHLEGKGDVEFVKTDISSEQSALDCAKATKDHFGKLDILINNAALYYDIDNARNDYEYLQRVFAVNLHGAWLMARACAPH